MAGIRDDSGHFERGSWSRVNHARSGLVAAVLAAAGTARAECPTTPDDPVCQPWTATLVPTAFAALYAPRAFGSQYYGGGLEAVLFAWSDNSAAFGPSQGRVRLDVAYLTGTAMRSGAMVMYRGGVQLAVERNASRSYAIPYFAVDAGGLWNDGIGRRWYVDGGLGLYLLHRRNVIVDLEVTGLLPLSDPGTLGGVTSRLGLSFAPW
jgi:hypothetical protein